MSQDNTVIATAATFMRDVIEASAQTPVLVDFWAPWCGPCKQLMPVLERLASEYKGRFRLAKVNTEEEQLLAQQIGVRSLPTVVLFKDRNAVTHFVGLQPEARIRALLDEHLEPVLDGPLARSQSLRASGDYAGARRALEEALVNDLANTELRTSLAELHVLDGELDTARAMLVELENREPQSAAVKRLAARLAFTDTVASNADLKALRERADTDAQARNLLAVHQLLGGEHRAAMDAWLTLMRSGGELKQQARENLVRAFDLLGEDEPLVSETRRAMARLLF